MSEFIPPVAVGVGIITLPAALNGAYNEPITTVGGSTNGSAIQVNSSKESNVTKASTHTTLNGSKKKTNDKHTNVRSGSQKNKAKQKGKGWEYRGNKKNGPTDLTP